MLKTPRACLLSVLILISATAAGVADAKDQLAPNEKLTPGQFLQNGNSKLILQQDGNLVLYRGTKVLWSTGTNKVAVRDAIMQGDGNFVLYRKDNKAIWASGTVGKPGSYLGLQADGSLSIFLVPPPVAIWTAKPRPVGVDSQ